MIGDHRLKQLLAENGARISIALGRRSVTHVIVGRPNGREGGAGGGLSGTKIQKEIQRARGCGIKFVSVEWVLESVKAGKRLGESAFVGVGTAPKGVGSVRDMFKKGRRPPWLRADEDCSSCLPDHAPEHGLPCFVTHFSFVPSRPCSRAWSLLVLLPHQRHCLPPVFTSSFIYCNTTFRHKIWIPTQTSVSGYHLGGFPATFPHLSWHPLSKASLLRQVVKNYQLIVLQRRWTTDIGWLTGRKSKLSKELNMYSADQYHQELKECEARPSRRGGRFTPTQRSVSQLLLVDQVLRPFTDAILECEDQVSQIIGRSDYHFVSQMCELSSYVLSFGRFERTLREDVIRGIKHYEESTLWTVIHMYYRL